MNKAVPYAHGGAFYPVEIVRFFFFFTETSVVFTPCNVATKLLYLRCHKNKTVELYRATWTPDSVIRYLTSVIFYQNGVNFYQICVIITNFGMSVAIICTF
jgi:hypothetical protein